MCKVVDGDMYLETGVYKLTFSVQKN